jgi:hypothetical protein
MMSTCCTKHVEARNKYIEKECVKLVVNQNYVILIPFPLPQWWHERASILHYMYIACVVLVEAECVLCEVRTEYYV